jgi:hypothetical protein
LVESSCPDLQAEDVDVLIENAHFTWGGPKEVSEVDKKEKEDEKNGE